jgi:dipeptidyl aminopeptidase/acylaminoacyl peptidase
LNTSLAFYSLLALALLKSISATAQTSPSGQSTPIAQSQLAKSLPPSSLFAAPRQLISPKLSPDGSKLAFRENTSGIKFFNIVNIETGKETKIFEPSKSTIDWFRWAGNETIIVKAVSNQTINNYEIKIDILFKFNLNDSAFSAVGKEYSWVKADNVIFIDQKGEYILYTLNSITSPVWKPDVFKINLSDNKTKKILDSENDIEKWITDDAGIVRMGIARHDSGSDIYYRRLESEKFKLVGRLREGGKREGVKNSLIDIGPITTGSDDGFVLSNKETGRFALHKFNYLTLQIGEKIFDHPENDVTDFSLNVGGSKLESARYTDSRDRIAWFDEQKKIRQSRLEAALPGQEVWMHEPTRDGKKMVVYATSATDPGSFYLYEPDNNKLRRFGGVNDEIDPEIMADTQYVRYAARDGKEIPAYLTLPKNREAENLPLIILPHGGPYGVRDTADFNSEVQFIASRGYAVLQPNFRGSDSYGEAFYEAGEGQIGRAMQDDLDDGMDWLVKQGIVDAKRVCLVGSSYGGYAALWGVIRNPERYRCAASFAGVTHFKKQLRYDQRFFSSRYAREWKEKVRGDKEFDLDLISPAAQAKRLTRPVLLTHGKDDTTVPFSQYKLMVAAAEDSGVAIETKVYEDEGHGFSKRENEQDWYDRLEAFLRKHNPPF